MQTRLVRLQFSRARNCTSLVATTATGPLRQRDSRVQVVLFAGAAGALQFEIEAIAEQVAPPLQTLRGEFGPAVQQRVSDVASTVARQGDQAVGAFGQPLAPNRW